MVLIPAGTFQMGDHFNEGQSDELPLHTVYVQAFCMGKCEVTNAQYRQFDSAHDSGTQEGHSFNGDDQPVVLVSWWDAVRYCNWRSDLDGLGVCYDESTGYCDLAEKGYRLPTEAEWEYAARGGSVGQRYVWGDGLPPSGAANLADETARTYWPWWNTFEGYDDGFAVTAPVGTFSPNGYGLHDMAGNALEWSNDWYDADYYSYSPSADPQGPSSGTRRVLRGGSGDCNPYDSRVSNRFKVDPTARWSRIGFRVSRSL